MTLYLDASVIVPTLFEESATAAVDLFLAAAADDLIVSDFAAAEVASALSRLHRMTHLTAGEAGGLLAEFDAWRAVATVGVDIERSDFRLADIFVRRFDLGLRAPDALHAAVCRRGGHRLVTLDAGLAAAARTLDIDVAVPG